ncbi:Signal transduction histidine kinase [Nonomuraea solani]|uniref:histidine kinase n=2 Tax=Nonomuraea solani TaxID=1144553 RepID=A0A1H6EYV1_9ACTN|nr:Signal transduction histidine kinase [Nonomuraea solani]
MLAAATVLTGFAMLDGEPPRPELPFLASVSLVAALPLTLAGRFPLTGALLSAAIALLGLLVPGWPGRLVTMVMFGAAAFHLPRRPWLVMSLSIAWTTGYGLLIPQANKGLSVVTDLVIMGVAPVAVGHILRLNGERAAQAAELDHAEARRAMAEERAGLARDVHDSVGHHLTAIRMQATATRRALRGQTPAADHTLATIAELSSAALKEVRALLDTLREAPVGPDLEEIEDLARRLSTPHLRISVHHAGSSAWLPPGVAHTVYRIVQEALTNAARHSGAAHVEVRVRRSRSAVTLSITDNGRARPGAEGRGIRGMRERVQEHGGTLTAGPGEHHGWRVEAVVPIAKGSASPRVRHSPSARREIPR